MLRPALAFAALAASLWPAAALAADADYAVDLKKATVPVGERGNASVIISTHGGWHFKAEAPLTLKLSPAKGVAVDTFGHVYVADALFDNIQIFDLSGRLLLSLGESGIGPGQFGLPNGIAIGLDNQIYVTDGYNHRVQVLKYTGQQ